MNPNELRQRAIALYDRFTHEHHDRRAFMAELTKLAGGAAAANALMMGIAADPAAAALVAEDDKRIKGANIRWSTADDRSLAGYLVTPAGEGKKLPAVMVIHENRGLTPHIRDVTRRVALAGFMALAPDFLSAAGGTPTDEDKARQLIGALDLSATLAEALATTRWLKTNDASTGKVGAIGFCWGGALTNRMAVAAGSSLAAAVPYYGPAPDPSEAAKVRTAMMIHLAGLDDRVNATSTPWVAALKAAKVPVEAFTYPNVNHAFNNDTSPERYDAAAATLAWDRTIAFLRKRLG